VVKDLDGWKSARADGASLAGVFSDGDAGALAQKIERIASLLTGTILDLGCGCGALYSRRDIVGVDWQLDMARRFGGTPLVADAGDPPFEPSSFDAVLLLNLLDCCSHPGLVLAQADALLKPEGSLVVSCPYAWTRATPPERRFTSVELLEALNGRLWLGLRSRYRILDHEDPVAWRLRPSERLVQEFACQVVVARKEPA
jgi:SAM-dependent methyltransferase